MDTTYFRKATTLASCLLRRPSDVYPWIRGWPLWGRQPIDRELPWISFGAIEHLTRFVRPSHAVLEFGGGGSTMFFARRASMVVTIENDANWHQAIVQATAAKGYTHVRCEHHPLAGDRPEQFAGSSFFAALDERPWDVVLVDCYCGFSASQYGKLRPHVLQLALEKAKPGALVVLDDSWMYTELLTPRPGWRIINHVGPGPCRYGVTSTTTFERLA